MNIIAYCFRIYYLFNELPWHWWKNIVAVSAIKFRYKIKMNRRLYFIFLRDEWFRRDEIHVWKKPIANSPVKDDDLTSLKETVVYWKNNKQK